MPRSKLKFKKQVKRIRRKVQDSDGDYYIQGLRGKPRKVKAYDFKNAENQAEKYMN